MSVPRNLYLSQHTGFVGTVTALVESIVETCGQHILLVREFMCEIEKDPIGHYIEVAACSPTLQAINLHHNAIKIVSTKRINNRVYF